MMVHREVTLQISCNRGLAIDSLFPNSLPPPASCVFNKCVFRQFTIRAWLNFSSSLAFSPKKAERGRGGGGKLFEFLLFFCEQVLRRAICTHYANSCNRWTHGWTKRSKYESKIILSYPLSLPIDTNILHYLTLAVSAPAGLQVYTPESPLSNLVTWQTSNF